MRKKNVQQTQNQLNQQNRRIRKINGADVVKSSSKKRRGNKTCDPEEYFLQSAENIIKFDIPKIMNYL